MSCILVVDDRRSDRELTVTVLGYAGYRVLEASSGSAALELARRERPDLVITDVLMPGMNGYELVRELREDSDLHGIEVIFSTSNFIEGEVRRLADACGVTHFLPKPCDPTTIVRIVGEVLGVDRVLIAPLRTEDFDREQRRLINDKLVQKINELEEVCAERQMLVEQLLRAHEDVCRRLAEQLHDDPIQAVVAAGMRLEMLLRRLDDPEDRAAVERIQVTIRAATSRLRAMVFALVPPELESQGLAVAVRAYLGHALESDRIHTTLHDRMTREPPAATRTLLYRMAQEALSNVRNHAGASNVEVTLDERAGFYSILITDDGRGFDPDEALRVRPGHLGLASMHQRVALAGGALRLSSRVGAGATVEITLPAELDQRIMA